LKDEPHINRTLGEGGHRNISKTGKPGGSFLPTYSPATNQFTLTGANVAYDANGNLLTDNLYSYTWDPNFGNPSSVTNQMGATIPCMGWFMMLWAHGGTR